MFIMADFQMDDQAVFSSAQLYCLELSEIRKNLHIARVRHDIAWRYDLLTAYFMALSARMKDIELIEHNNSYDAVTKAFNEYQRAVALKHPTIPRGILELFNTWEIQLRKTENSLGLLTPSRKDPRFALYG